MPELDKKNEDIAPNTIQEEIEALAEKFAKAEMKNPSEKDVLRVKRAMMASASLVISKINRHFIRTLKS